MRALVMAEFGGPLVLSEVPAPPMPEHGARIGVTATGVCRSDWHAWLGHDGSVALPHVPGHEFAGVVQAVGSAVDPGWVGQRVTAPFVNACGACPNCRHGRPTTCQNQTQPGFDRWGSWAELVVVDHAEVNLVALPDELDDATAAALGCRFATAYRAVVTLAAVTAGDQVLVVGCGGVGLAAIMVAASRGARVVAVDPSPSARALAQDLGAAHTLTPEADLVTHVRDLTGGVQVSLDCLGRSAVLAQCLASLRPGGRHVQVGLLLGADAGPAVDMGRVIGQELQILGSHGMAAGDYPAMLADLTQRRLDPGRLVGRSAALSDAETALRAMSSPGQGAGTTVLIPSR